MFKKVYFHCYLGNVSLGVTRHLKVALGDDQT